MRFSQSNHLLMYLSIIRNSWPIFVQLSELANSVMIFFYLKRSHSNGSLSYSVPWVWLSESSFFGFISFFLRWHWEILIMLLPQSSLNFLQTQKGVPLFIAQIMTILIVTGTVFVIIWEMFHGRISLNSVLLLLVLNFAGGSRLEMMYILLIVNSRSSLVHLYGFSAACAAVIALEITSFVCSERINLLHLKWNSGSLVIVARRFLKLSNLLMLIKQKNLSLPRTLAFATFRKLLIILYLHYLTLILVGFLGVRFEVGRVKLPLV